MGDTRLPLEYMVSSSQSALESMELGRLNQVSNLRKELREVLEEWIDCEVDARLARWILERRRAQTTGPAARAAEPEQLVRSEQLALSLLPSPRGLPSSTENQRDPAPRDHQGLAGPAPTPARTADPTDMRKPVAAVASRRGRRFSAPRPATIPDLASRPAAAPALAPAPKSAAIELRALDHGAHGRALRLLRTPPPAAKADNRAPFWKPTAQGLALAHSLQRQPVVQHGVQSRDFVPRPERTQSIIALASRSAPKHALGAIEAPPQSSRLRLQLSILSKTPASARQRPMRPGPLAPVSLRPATGCA